MRYSVQPRNDTFLKGYRFLSSLKKMGKNIGTNISKKWSGKYNQRFLDHTKKSAEDPFKTASKRAIQKTAKSTNYLLVIKSEKLQKVHNKKIQRQF